MVTFRLLWPYVIRYRVAFALGLLCSVATTGITLLGPLVLRRAVDDISHGVSGRVIETEAAALVLVAIVGGVFRFWTRRILIGASREIEYDVRNDLFAHLQRMPQVYYQRHRVGDLMSRATSDLNAVRMMIGPSVMYAANTGLTFVAAMAMMARIDGPLTLAALLPLPCVSIAVIWFGRAIHDGSEQIQAQLADLSAVTQEAVAGVRVVRAYRREAHEVARFAAANEELVRRSRVVIALQGTFFPSISFFLGLGSVLVLWVGSRAVLAHRITVGEFVAFSSYLTMLAWPMIAFGWVTNLVQRGLASWGRLCEVFEAQPVASDGVPHAIRGEVEFRHLTFGYGETPVLHDVSVRVPVGQTLAVVGATGSGKSTLVQLLARLMEPPPGAVFLDGMDVRDLSLATVRGAIGMVMQEPFLFSDTLRANVALGLDADADRTPEDRDARIARAVETAHLTADIAGFPAGLDTVVGERGITLSGGQKQRTALARAVALEPTILVFDDALSAVDTQTEEGILGALATVLRQRTAIIVAHRLSTVRHADHILVLDGGRVVEQGTHDVLCAAGGLYAGLYARQQLERALEEA